MAEPQLLRKIQLIAEKAKLGEIAVAFRDFESNEEFSHCGDRWFHAASTFKAALLFALFKAAEGGRVHLDDQLHIRNRFVSIAGGGIFRVERNRDGDSVVHQRIGRSMTLLDLAGVMITRSSNLATNLLLDLLSLDFVRTTLEEAGVAGVEVRRGVEDLAAHDLGINNEATAKGLLRLFRLFLDTEGALSENHRQQALEILFAQEFGSMLPARLPDGVRVAHKTGEISTHCHDAGIVFPTNRRPYVIAIMTGTLPETENRAKAVAEISAAVFHHLQGKRCERESADE